MSRPFRILSSAVAVIQTAQQRQNPYGRVCPSIACCYSCLSSLDASYPCCAVRLSASSVYTFVAFKRDGKRHLVTILRGLFLLKVLSSFRIRLA